ncbi:MAG: hypothetical protein EGQ84_02045 [Slackia sp.]|nr:hypothetical protein [Slackia sp.]
MNDDNDLRALYLASQKDVHAPEQLKERTLELLDDNDTVLASAALEPARKQRFMGIGRKPLYGIAACLALAALGFGAVQAMMHTNGGDADVGALETANLDFTVKAYAAGTQSPLAAGDNGMIVFGHTSDLSQSSPEWDDNGTYTGCLFKVEAEGVKTVQAHISKGMLYRYDTQNVSYASNSELLYEASTWKPLKRGLGEHLSAYDKVAVGIANDGLSKDDPNKTYQVQMSKRLGQTAELNYDEGDEGAYFGLWTDEVGDSDTSDDSKCDQFGAIANAFEGAELTVTVTFEDGRTSTQVINLHAGNFLADWNDGSGEDLGALAIQSTLLEDGAEVPESALVLRTVYGEVASSTREAFPYANEPINEYANTTDEPMKLPNDGTGDFLESGVQVELAKASEVLSTYASAATDESSETMLDSKNEQTPSLTVNGISTELVDSLPESTPVEKTEIARMAPLDYWNRIIEQRCGFTIGSDWKASDGASILHVGYSLTNSSDERKLFRVPSMQSLGRIDGSATFYSAGNSAAPLMFVGTKNDGSACGWYDNDVATLEPGESMKVDCYYEVSNSLSSRNDLAIAFGANDIPNIAVRISLA